MTAKIIKRYLIAFCITLTIIATFAVSASTQVRTYTDITPDGARAAIAYGINARGDIVGIYVDQNYVNHGFLFRKGVLSPIDFPGADGTDVRGIGPNGEFVGNYWYASDPAVGMRGFKWTKEGGFESVHYPGHSWEILQRILPDGVILGCRHDTDTMSTMRGVFISGDDYGEIDAYGSMNNGATPSGQTVVGLWFNMMENRQEGYINEKGVFTTFVVPGSNLTAAWDINAGGSIAGVFRVGTVVRGFVRTGDDYSTIHFPGSSATRAFGINSGGDVVGSYNTGGVTRAFVANIVDE